MSKAANGDSVRFLSNFISWLSWSMYKYKSQSGMCTKDRTAYSRHCIELAMFSTLSASPMPAASQKRGSSSCMHSCGLGGVHSRFLRCHTSKRIHLPVGAAVRHASPPPRRHVRRLRRETPYMPHRSTKAVPKQPQQPLDNHKGREMCHACHSVSCSVIRAVSYVQCQIVCILYVSILLATSSCHPSILESIIIKTTRTTTITHLRQIRE